MALGFNIGGTQIQPDRALSRPVKFRRRVANFGDGYSQRIPSGINTIDETFSVTFNNRDAEEIDMITSYLELLGGVTSFPYTLEKFDSGVSVERTINVICEDFSQIYSYRDYNSATITLKKVNDL